jgi:hypothetical protein
MDEFSINRLSSMDCDRQTPVRALKDTPADAGTERKPLFRVSTAVTALDHHHSWKGFFGRANQLRQRRHRDRAGI